METKPCTFAALMEIWLMHHYWVDSGSTVFDSLTVDRKKQILSPYDVRSFLSIAPLPSTKKKLAGLGCRFRDTAVGCVVGVPEERVIPADSIFEFAISIRDASFFNYTALTLLPQKLFRSGEYSFKENVPVLSNTTGASRGAGPDKSLFLSRDVPALAADDKVESLFRSGTGALMQLNGDQPGADSHQLAPATAGFPVFVNQGDIPAIAAPPGVTGVPARGIALTGDIPDNVFALIRIHATRPDDPDFNIIDGTGHARAAGPVFHVRFKNRSTVWKYFNKNTSSLLATESQPLPLTRWGNAGTKQKPESLVKAEKDGDRIVRLVSDVYV